MAAEGEKSKEQIKAEERGDEFMIAAQKRLEKWSLFSSNSKFEEAAELYDKAASQFKVAKDWHKAADAYVKAADMAGKLKSEHEMTTHYVNAAKAYKNVSTEDACRMFRLAVELHMENNRFSTAAKLHKEIAELEEKAMNIKPAIKAYSDAADCFFAEDAHTSGNQMLLKVAELAAGEEDYKRAIQIFEKVAASSLEQNLLKWSVKDYLYKAALCHLVLGAKQGDVKECEEALQKYVDMHPAFDGSREQKFLEQCLSAFNERDVEAFTGHVFKFDSVLKLDNWTAQLLLEVKTVLKEGGAGLIGAGGPELDLT